MGHGGGGSSVGLVQSAVKAYNLRDASNWWHDVNDSPLWQDRIFHALALLYGLVAIVALVFLSLSICVSISISMYFFINFHTSSM